MFKHLLLWNRLANQSQILCGASLGRGNESLYKCQVTWPRWPPCPYMVKTFKNLLLQNQKSYDLETWHVALGTQVLQNYINEDPGLTLTYFTARSNLVLYAFVWEKGKTMDFSETIVVYDLKLATDDRSDKKFLLTSKLCPLGAICPQPWGYIHVLNHEKNV